MAEKMCRSVQCPGVRGEECSRVSGRERQRESCSKPARDQIVITRAEQGRTEAPTLVRTRRSVQSQLSRQRTGRRYRKRTAPHLSARLCVEEVRGGRLSEECELTVGGDRSCFYERSSLLLPRQQASQELAAQPASCAAATAVAGSRTGCTKMLLEPLTDFSKRGSWRL